MDLRRSRSLAVVLTLTTAIIVGYSLLIYLEVHFPLSYSFSVPTHAHSHHISALDDFEAYMLGKHYFPMGDLIRNFSVRENGSDVIIFMRIQKTGSTTLTTHMLKHFDFSPWCHCKNLDANTCDCVRKWKFNVLFMEAPYKWPCKIHADWTYLHECAEQEINKRHGRTIKQRHLYITMVRDPLQRFVSEWQQVRRGVTWKGTKLICNGHAATNEELPRCFKTDWRNVTLHDFIGCPTNLGINRQTRMLADLRIVGCYNTSASGLTYEERHYRMLASAKENLRSMAFFGLTSYQELSQILFEQTFNLKFVLKFNNVPSNKTWSGKVNLSNRNRAKILHINRFDDMLYQYAKDLFFQRLQVLAVRTNDFSLQKLIESSIDKY